MSVPPSREADAELAAVKAELERLDPGGARSARVLRDTFDQLYDGQRTGRYLWKDLYKTEKTHCGTLVEINLQREFVFDDGKDLDYKIAGVEVDCKYSQKLGSWMIPPEAQGHLCLVVWGEDTAQPDWKMGLVRADDAHLNPGVNRDGKKTLNKEGKAAIQWLWLPQRTALPPNVLLQLDAPTLTKIFSHQHGTKRVDELFRLAQQKRVGRATVATVARQDDYMKRVRANGGSRTALQPEGIIILGQYSSHVAIAESLNIEPPSFGEFVSVKVSPAKELGEGVAEIDGRLWKVAGEHDPIAKAPILPQV